VQAARDKISHIGVKDAYTIFVSGTHKKLIEQAQRNELLHQDIGYIRALELAPTVYFYDVGLMSIDGKIFSRGTSLDLDEAVARAFGELYERVSMRFPPSTNELFHAKCSN
jgi:hypothetical protein